MALVAGVTGTCVQISEHSGGFPTALFFFQSLICLVGAALSLILLDGLGQGRAGREAGQKHRMRLENAAELGCSSGSARLLMLMVLVGLIIRYDCVR